MKQACRILGITILITCILNFCIALDTSFATASNVKLIYSKSIELEDENVIIFLASEKQDKSQFWTASAIFNGKNAELESVLTQLITIIFLSNEFPTFMITLEVEDEPYVLFYSDGEFVFPLGMPEEYLEMQNDTSLWVKYADECFYLLDSISDLGKTKQLREVLETGFPF